MRTLRLRSQECRVVLHGLLVDDLFTVFTEASNVKHADGISRHSHMTSTLLITTYDHTVLFGFSPSANAC